MKTILFAAHDPGGANVLKPVAEFFAGLPEWHIILVLLGPAAERITLDGANVERITVRTQETRGFPNELSVVPEDLAAVIDQTKPDVVFTATSFNSNLERLTILFANEREILTATILDYWSRYAYRFTSDRRTNFPNTIFVADKRMRTECKAEVDENVRVVISGNPHLQAIGTQYADARKQFDAKPITRIRFFSENIHHYHPHKAVNEFMIVKALAEMLDAEDFMGELIVRPHPMESREAWEPVMSDLKNLLGGRITLDTVTFDEVLRENSAAIGLTSMALLETAVCGIPTFSYQIDIPQDDGYFMLPFEEYGIEKLLQSNDIAVVTQSTAQNSKSTYDAMPISIICNTIEQLLA